MSHFYVAGDLAVGSGRVLLGTLHNDELTISEVRRFPNVPLEEKGVRQWNIPQLYHEVLEGLRSTGLYEEPIDSVSCTSWGGDYLLFEADGTLITPGYESNEERSEPGKKAVFSKIPWESIYEETGVGQNSANTLFQLAADSSRRLKQASHLLPIADAFNYLLSGVPRVETSLAATTQLFNPVEGDWSERLINALRLPARVLPPLVPAGTPLGPLRPEIANDVKLQEAQVVSSCSHHVAAALLGLPISSGERWAFLRPGSSTLFGTQVAAPIINDVSRELNFTHELGYGGALCFYRSTVGLWLQEECQRFWEQHNRQLDPELLGHLAGSATPFESLIDPMDPRFSTPGDMPLKIQAYCKETNQPLPRKPGPVFRCVMESLALHYRKLLHELEYLTGSQIERVYVLGGSDCNLLNHFTANALEVPIVVVPPEITGLGNVVGQALALGHIKSIEHAREIVRGSLKVETIIPHATAWNSAYDRFASLSPAPADAPA